GLQMAFQTESIIIVLLSILTGALIGEFLNLEERLNELGLWIGARFATSKTEGQKVSQAFVTASLIFVVGAMAILGALDSRKRRDNVVMITKGILDGFVAFVCTSTLDLGLVFSIIPVLLFQSTIELLATPINGVILLLYFNMFIVEITVVVGLLSVE